MSSPALAVISSGALQPVRLTPISIASIRLAKSAEPATGLAALGQPLRLTTDPRAYALYLEALPYVAANYSMEVLDILLDLLDRAIAIDPSFAKAYEAKAPGVLDGLQ